ncbi:MAG: MerR family transcriptional regulator [Deltaproteobacteria bacterium]|jgi:hypothetical protein|nr:MerR family transcriptional regulator [Deltaproteobacteria bacterium]
MTRQLPAGQLLFKAGEIAEKLDLQPSVVRHWEKEFAKHLKPIRLDSGRKLYRKGDLEFFAEIKRLLRVERLTVEGAKLRIAQGQLSRRGRISQDDLQLPEDAPAGLPLAGTVPVLSPDGAAPESAAPPPGAPLPAAGDAPETPVPETAYAAVPIYPETASPAAPARPKPAPRGAPIFPEPSAAAPPARPESAPRGARTAAGQAPASPPAPETARAAPGAVEGALRKLIDEVRLELFGLRDYLMLSPDRRPKRGPRPAPRPRGKGRKA